MKKLFLLAALCVAAAFSSCSKHDNEINDVEPPVLPDEPTRELAIAFAEGNSLEFNINETKTVHYTITGGSDKTVIKAEMQKSDDAYTVKTTPTSATEGTIAITAQTPSTENCVIVTVSDDDQSITAEIAVSTNALPEKEKLAITFDEGNSLEFNVNETKTVHYTITGGSENTVVTAEMQKSDDTYTVETTPASATEGTIAITAKTPSTENCVLVTVSDSDRTITVSIDITVTLKASFDGKTVVVETPGTLAQLLADYDTTEITELTVIGNLNGSDIVLLGNRLPNLAVLDMEHVNLEVLQGFTFEHNTSLTSIKLPRTLKTIGEQAFHDCTSLKSITIPNSVTTIKRLAFASCSSLKSITIPNTVTEIEDQICNSCSSLTSITIPDGVTSIGYMAFSWCTSLTSITIPDSVTEIGYNTFYYCDNLKSVYITDIVKWYSIKFENVYSNPMFSMGNLYLNGELVTELVFPDNVTTIGNSVFTGCRSLTSVTIPDSVTKIGESAFERCTNLTSITIGNGVMTIGKEAFQYCSSLKTIYCKAQTPPSVNSYTFQYVNASATLYVPTGCKAAYAAADEWNKFTIIETEF